RGNAVPLLFARVLGCTTCDVSGVAVARVGVRRPGIVGLSSIKISGNTLGIGVVTDSYSSSSAGTFTGATPTYGRGSLMSNGDITLSGNTVINGDARPGVAKTVSVGGNATVTGPTQPLAAPLSYPMLPAGTYATANHDTNIPGPYPDDKRNFNTGNGSVSLSAGNYYVNDFVVG